jgi:hypothetical protein
MAATADRAATRQSRSARSKTTAADFSLGPIAAAAAALLVLLASCGVASLQLVERSIPPARLRTMALRLDRDAFEPTAAVQIARSATVEPPRVVVSAPSGGRPPLEAAPMRELPDDPASNGFAPPGI